MSSEFDIFCSYAHCDNDDEWVEKFVKALTSPAASIVVNPQRMYEGVLRHFEQYIKDLRCGSRPDLTDKFQKAVSLLWALEEGKNVIGLTEDEFKGRA